MAQHKTIDLELRRDKPENVYRYIDDWKPIPSSHGPEAFYLLLHGVFQWGSSREIPVRGFSVAMQYSTTTGKRVDVSQPAHIHEADVGRVLGEFASFVDTCTNKGKAK